ncbi:MAG: hypothetical protein Q9228_004252 [Teloschistes exilis]
MNANFKDPAELESPSTSASTDPSPFAKKDPPIYTTTPYETKTYTRLSGKKILAAELEGPQLRKMHELDSGWTGGNIAELPMSEPVFELPPADSTLGGSSHELSVPDHVSRLNPISHLAHPFNNGVATPGSAPVPPEIPRSNPHALSFNTEGPRSSAYTFPPEQVRPSPLNLKRPSARHTNQTSDLVNVESSITGASWAFSNRRSKPPTLSIVTTQSRRSNHGQPMNVVPSQRNTQADLSMTAGSSSFSKPGEFSQTLERSVRSRYNIEPSSTYPTIYTRPVHAEAEFQKVEEIVSPSSANSALQSPPFDPSAFKSPVINNMQFALPQALQNEVVASESVPATADSSSRHDYLLHRGSEQDISSAFDMRKPPSTSQIPFDCTPFQGISTTKHLLQDLETRVTSLHHLCTSTLDSGTDHFNDIFGSSGYATCMQGLQVMGSMIQGSVPRTGKAICALVQVALQIPLQMAPCQISIDFADRLGSSIRGEIYRLSLAIEDKSVRGTLLDDMNFLVAKWQSMQSRPAHVTSKASAREGLSHTYHEQERSLKFADAQLVTCSFDELLKSSIIIQIISCYLDRFECLELAEKNSSTPFYSPVRDGGAAGNSIMNNVICPLLLQDACASMSRVVWTVGKQLQCGFLYNVREVEIMLMYYAPQCDVAEETLDEFRRCVRNLCDHEQSLDPGTCRMRQYCNDIGRMQANLQDLGKREGGIDRTRPAIKFHDPSEMHKLENTTRSVPSPPHRSRGAPLRILRPRKPAVEKIGNAISGPSRHLSSESPIASLTASFCPSTPVSSLFSNQRAGRRSTFNSTIDGSGASSPTVGVRCPDCDFLFKGSPLDSRNNLKRHQRDIHTRKSMIRCTFKDCLVDFTRSDNLLRHRRKAHALMAGSTGKKGKVI